MNEQISPTPIPEQPSAPGASSEPLAAVPAASVRPWWQARWVVPLALALIVLLGAYFRFLNLTDWDSGTMLHPDERFFTQVTTAVRVPASIEAYFDAAGSPGNPRNVGHGFFVYGTFPVMLTRATAVFLTPPEALPEEVPDTRAIAAGADAGGQIANPERTMPRLPWLISLFNPDGVNLTSYGWVQQVGRVWVALFDLASIVLVYFIGARLYDRRVGLLAALLSALAVMQIQQSHFYVDPTFSTFFALLALYWAVRVAQGGGVWSYVALGTSIGFAMGNRVTLAALGLVAIVATFQAALVWREQQRREAAEPVDPDAPEPAPPAFFHHLLLHKLPLLVLAGMITLVMFRIVQPYAFIGSTPQSPPHEGNVAAEAGPLDWLHGLGFLDVRPSPRFLDNMRSVQSQVTGEADMPPSQQWVNRTDHFFPWINMVLWGMGPALGITVWLAWAVAGGVLLRRAVALLRGRAVALALAPLVLWFWVAFYFGWQGAQFASTMRYMLPIYGALIVLGAWLLVVLWDRATRRSDVPQRGRAVGAWAQRLLLRPPPALRWTLVLVVLATLAWAYAFTRIYTRDHSRVMAAHWLVQHAPPGSYVAAEVWDDALPLQAVGPNLWGTLYRGIQTAPYAEDDPRKYFGMGSDLGLLDQLEQADYITLTSNRVYDSIERLPMRYPVLHRYYYHLFNENLGFRLAAEITSYPTLFGLRIPDHWAEEAFTVYDHPRVLIFEKTREFSRERAEELITDDANWSEVYKLPVGVADRAPTALRFTPGEWELYAQGGTWAERWNPQSVVNSDVVAPLVWLLVLEGLGLAMFALLFRLLPWLPDRGWTLARPLGLLLVAYAAWLLGSWRLLPFAPSTMWLCALPLLAGGAWVAWRSRGALRAFWRERRTALLTAQALYLAAFAIMLYVRWLNPDLWHPARGGEKPMDFAYLNAVLQSAAFPPYDPWFAGGYINYYYFGFVIVGALVHLTTIVPAVAYNLAVPSLFALTALGAWGVVYNLLAPRAARKRAAVAQAAQAAHADPPAQGIRRRGYRLRQADQHTPPRLRHAAAAPATPAAAPTAPAAMPRSRPRALWRQAERRARLAALLAPLFVVIVGNLAQALWFVSGYAAENAHRSEWAFWDATRIVQGTVNEFPFFTFLFADLHAHMIVMPFSLALVGLLVALVRRPAARLWAGWGVLGLLGLLAGTLRVTNTWDYPTFVGLTAATLVLLGWWGWQQARRVPSPADPPLLTTVRWLVGTLAQVVLVLLLGNLLFLPFISQFATESSGVDLLREGGQAGWLNQVVFASRTALWDLLRLYGLWLFLLISAGLLLARNLMGRFSLREHSGTLFVVGLLVGAAVFWTLGQMEAGASVSGLWLLLPLGAGWAWLAWQMRYHAPRRLLPLLWAGTGLALCIGVDLLVVRGDVGRMNTVFKFGLHAWMLFALAAAVALPWAWRQIGVHRTDTGERQVTPPGQMWRGAVLLLLAAALVYPLTATPARIGDRYAPDLPHTLDGAAFMEYVQGHENGTNFPLDEDAAAIAWMQQNIEGTPLLLEAHLPSYRWAGRIATYTGLPTLLGWEWHQIQQRMAANTTPIVHNRQDTIARIYGDPNAGAGLELLRLYGIEYVYVGGVERAVYPAEGLAKFEQLAQQGALEPVFASGTTRLYRVVQPGEPTVFTTDLPIVAPTKNTPPPLMLDEPVAQLPTVDEYAWNDWASASSWAALLTWLAALYVLPLLGLPLAVRVFGGWRDGGWVWARVLGLLLLGYAVWLPTSLGVWHYDRWGMLGGLLLLLALNVWLLRQIPGGFVGIGRHVWAHRRAVLLREGLFLAGFLAFVGIRALNPDLWHPVWGGEKPMELGFLNAILRSPVMPPYDPFFSGGYINYYYYGIYLVSLPIKATGIAPALAFNLVVPTVFALTLVGGYALVAQLTGRVRYGLLGAAFVAVLGNLSGVVAAGQSRGWGDVWQQMQQGGLAGLGARLGDWFIGPSRVVPHTINEFPFWTFLFADLHPHMLALPLALLLIALAYRYVRGSEDGAPLPAVWYVLAPLVLGALAVTNSWDFPTYGLLLGAAVVGAAWRRGVGWADLLRAVLLAAGLGVAAMALYTPFFDNFYAFVSGVGAVDVWQDGTGIRDYLLLYGLFLAVLLPFVLGTLWRFVRGKRPFGRWAAWLLGLALCVLLPLALALFAVVQPVASLLGWLAALLLLGGGLLLWRRLDAAAWFVLLLALLGWAVSLGVELVFIRDHLAGGDAYRMNTVFKFGLHIWTLLALAAAAALPWVLRGLGRLSQRRGWGRATLQAPALLLLGVLVALAAFYPLVGTPSRIAYRFPVSLGPTLDGLAFLEQAEFDYNCAAWGGCERGTEQVMIDLEADAAAIAWLNEQIAGTPVVLQSNLWFYRSYAIRVAANTGLPTVISALHTNEQRDPTLTLQRNDDVERLFRMTDTETTLRLLAQYNVDYIYVGPVERAVYGAAGLNKFDRMADTYLNVVYDEPGVRIYQVTGIPPNYAQPEPFLFVDERSVPANPVGPSEGAAPPPVPDVAPDTERPADPPTADELSNAQVAYGMALELRAADQLAEAERVLRLAAADNPEDVGLHHLWGDILMQMENYDEAAFVYERIATRVPTAGNWNKLGWSLLQWDQIERAEEAFVRAIQIDSSEPAPHFYLGQMDMERGLWRQAAQRLERYLALAPDGQFRDEAQRMLAEIRASETDDEEGDE